MPRNTKINSVAANSSSAPVFELRGSDGTDLDALAPDWLLNPTLEADLTAQMILAGVLNVETVFPRGLSADVGAAIMARLNRRAE